MVNMSARQVSREPYEDFDISGNHQIYLLDYVSMTNSL